MESVKTASVTILTKDTFETIKEDSTNVANSVITCMYSNNILPLSSIKLNLNPWHFTDWFTLFMSIYFVLHVFNLFTFLLVATYFPVTRSCRTQQHFFSFKIQRLTAYKQSRQPLLQFECSACKLVNSPRETPASYSRYRVAVWCKQAPHSFERKYSLSISTCKKKNYSGFTSVTIQHIILQGKAA